MNIKRAVAACDDGHHFSQVMHGTELAGLVECAKEVCVQLSVRFHLEDETLLDRGHRVVMLGPYDGEANSPTLFTISHQVTSPCSERVECHAARCGYLMPPYHVFSLVLRCF